MTDAQRTLERELERLHPPRIPFERLERRRERKQRDQRIAAGVLGIAVFVIAALGFVRLFGSEGTPASDPRRPFEGTWISTTDADGGTQTMTVTVSADDAVEIVVLDDIATVCSGAPSTMTGTGRIEDGTRLVIPEPVYTCDDGSEPEAISGPPLEEQLRDWTLFLDPQADTLSDGSGGLWLREGAEVPSPDPAVSGEMWPQSSLEEVREAQELADAGDPDYTWQVDAEMAAQNQSPMRAEILTRFLRDGLGWEAFDFGILGRDEGEWYTGEGTYTGVVFVRCAPGGANALYPNDPTACAPTIDGLRYETVSIDAAQLDRRGPTGVWVVTRHRMLPPFQQATPPSDAEIAAVLNGFIDARVAGEGAERYLADRDGTVPLLYETTGGARYTRGGFEIVSGPEWPYGFLELEVRLFAGETVVEQRFYLDPCPRASASGCVSANEALTLDGPVPTDDAPATTEDGQAVPDRFSIVDDEITFAAIDPPWRFVDWFGSGPTMSTLLWDGVFGGLKLVADPLPVGTGCEADPAVASAAEMAERILSDPDIDATEPVAVRVGGVDALRMDIGPAVGASLCDRSNEPVLFTSEEPHSSTDVSLWHRHSYRLYLLDVPSGSSRVLAIVVFGPDQDLEAIAEAAAPVLDSIEFGS